MVEKFSPIIIFDEELGEVYIQYADTSWNAGKWLENFQKQPVIKFRSYMVNIIIPTW